VKSDSRKWHGKYWDASNWWKGGNSLRSFLFTLRNPHGVPPRKFALKAERKHEAICCNSACGPGFGDWCIFVCNNCNKNTGCHTFYFGETYESVGGREEKEFLTGAVRFTVKEIEVFNIVD
jgi:hypothetical protein